MQKYKTTTPSYEQINSTPTFSFILMLLACAMLGFSCGSRTLVRDYPTNWQSDKSADWFERRAKFLGISLEEAKARDAKLSEKRPAKDMWDAQLKDESAQLWNRVCATCHGPNGKLEGTILQPPLPKKLGGMGMTMGFTFGGDAMRAGIYRVIRDGKNTGKASAAMPGWKGQLSKEQLWGLVLHIEEAL